MTPAAQLATPRAPAWDGEDRFRAQVASVVSESVLPHLEEWEREETLPRAFFRACGEAGLTGAGLPRELGGGGLPFRSSLALTEEFMRLRATGPAVSLLVASNGVCPLLARRASPALREELLAPLVGGQAVGALGITEPSGGSALPHTVRCTAERRGGDWVLTGEKVYITNAPIADVVLLLVRTDPGPGPFALSLIAVPADAPGFERVAQHRKLGLGASPTGHLRLDRCRVPARFAVGTPGHGYAHLLPVLSQERLLVAAGALAYARSVLAETAARLTPVQRERGRGELGRMHARLLAGHAFVRGAAERVSEGNADAGSATLAKFALCELAQRVAEGCARLLGPRAALEGSGLDRVLREVRVLSVFAGTSETMRALYGSRVAALTRQAILEETEV